MDYWIVYSVFQDTNIPPRRQANFPAQTAGATGIALQYPLTDTGIAVTLGVQCIWGSYGWRGFDNPAHKPNPARRGR